MGTPNFWGLSINVQNQQAPPHNLSLSYVTNLHQLLFILALHIAQRQMGASAVVATQIPYLSWQDLTTLCLKKVPTLELSVTLSNLSRFWKCLHCWKAYEICFKTYMTLPSHIRHVATLPWEIENSNFWPSVICACVLQLSQQLINTPRFIQLFSEKFVCPPLCCVPLQIQTFYQNVVPVTEYHVDWLQTLQRRLLWWISDVTNWSLK